MTHDSSKVGNLAAMHIGRGLGNITQAWGLLRTNQFAVVLGEAQFDTLIRFRIAVVAKAIEIILSG